MAGAQVRRFRLWQDRVETEVEIAGSGPPLVYLHGPWGLGPDRAFVARLAGARIELIDQAGHLPQLEQPEAVAKAVQAFLGS